MRYSRYHPFLADALLRSQIVVPSPQVHNLIHLAEAITIPIVGITRIKSFDYLTQRAEHNEGLITNLEEVSLHQQNIEKIELLGHVCRWVITTHIICGLLWSS